MNPIEKLDHVGIMLTLVTINLRSEVEVVKIGTSYIKSIIVDSPKYLQNNYYNSAGLGSKEL